MGLALDDFQQNNVKMEPSKNAMVFVKSSIFVYLGGPFLELKNIEVLPWFHTGGLTSSTCNLVFFQRLSHDEHQGKLVIEPNLMPSMGLVYLPRFG